MSVSETFIYLAIRRMLRLEPEKFMKGRRVLHVHTFFTLFIVENTIFIKNERGLEEWGMVLLAS